MNTLEFLVRDLPSPDAARRFFEQFSEQNPSQVSRLLRNEGLLSDLLTLASYSPLLATTLIQSPEYIGWLAKERANLAVRDKDELLESLARFAMTHSQLEPHVLFARFRRRELLRIFLRDIRRLSTVAEITEDISNLADAILENALRAAWQEMDARYGRPFEVDDRGRRLPSDICIVSLGKLGSKELNYSSDIDLLFIYSAECPASEGGSQPSLSNREYFVRLAEIVTRLVGRQSGEGAAYRVDLRLRPHGRVGALALSLKETVKYYLTEARGWEQQVLIRSRASAGNAAIFKQFFSSVQDVVFQPGRNVEKALEQVLRSKEKIDHERRSEARFDVKLGRGGIREIEFIAQALQLAHGGTDRWLRAPHTLISISRLADRGVLSTDERWMLSNAYEFLRGLEHILQMEHGLQTHSLPGDALKLDLIAARMGCRAVEEFETELTKHTNDVHASFVRVFGRAADSSIAEGSSGKGERISAPSKRTVGFVADRGPSRIEDQVIASLERLDGASKLDAGRLAVLRHVSESAPRFAQLIAAKPWLVEYLKKPEAGPPDDFADTLARQVDPDAGFATALGAVRTVWSRLHFQIVLADIYEAISPAEVRMLQTRLAEASIDLAIEVSANELSRRHGSASFDPSILSLGKLSSRTLDYDSDLDLVLIYSELELSGDAQMAASEIYSRGVELFVNFLSGMTRDGNLYRVDLRLRPHGKNGPSVTTDRAFIDYIENDASIWELLAYVQMREVRAMSGTKEGIEAAAREAIQRRSGREDAAEVRRESRNMRLRLEETHGRGRREVDIKFGAGGLLDVYFVVRYLQLTSGDTVDSKIRSTSARLDAFHQAGMLSPGDHAALHEGHAFLSAVDHNIRLIIGRSSRFPRANHSAVERIAERMVFSTGADLLRQLSLHRVEIRGAFENIFGR